MGKVKSGEEGSCAFTGDGFHELLAHVTIFPSLLMLRLGSAILGGLLALRHLGG